tara:strand:- start:430 stop:723 length:294 start_codon:yes stop_codon:yes gene_type:complete
MAKLNDTLNVGQFIIATVVLLLTGVGSFYAVSEQVTRNQARIENLEKEIDRSIRPEIQKFDDKQARESEKLNLKLDNIANAINELKVELERKEDRRR